MGKVNKIIEGAKRPKPGSVTIRVKQQILDELARIAKVKNIKSRNRLISSILKDFVESYKKTKGVS
jgi:metal-responsive CopG/Arc/MetJ family transcriptional regulator